MAHDLYMGEDGILRIKQQGDFDRTSVEALMKDYTPFIEAATEIAPLNIIFDASETVKLSPASRRTLTEMNKDPRFGKMAIIGASRMIRVFASFISKATNRNNIKLVSSDPEAVQWIKNNAKIEQIDD